MVDPVRVHLKELSASKLTGPTIIAFLASQMSTLTQLLHQVRTFEVEETSEKSIADHKRKLLPRFVQSLLRLQRIVIDVLECPPGRVLDCLLALST